MQPPVKWDENNLLFTKRFQVMNKIIGYSFARTVMNTKHAVAVVLAWYSRPLIKRPPHKKELQTFEAYNSKTKCSRAKPT